MEQELKLRSAPDGPATVPSRQPGSRGRGRAQDAHVRERGRAALGLKRAKAAAARLRAYPRRHYPGCTR